MGTTIIPDLPDITQGNDIVWSLFFKEDDGTAIDITGSTIYFIVKTNQTDPDSSAEISKTITSHPDPTGGESRLILTDVETDIASGKYYGEFQYNTAAAKITTVASTHITILEKIKDA